MDKAEIGAWAETFAADLLIAGTKVPIDRVLDVHLDVIQALRRRGMTWTGLSLILTRGGARRANGGVISPGQLRAAVSRLLRRGTGDDFELTQVSGTTEPATSPVTRSSRPAPSNWRKSILPSSGPEPETVNSVSNPLTTKDLTDDDIATALHRISRRLP